MLTLQYATPETWTETVLNDFDHFLADHAAAEKKASGMAVSMLSHYPDRPQIVKAMIDLAIEEMTHFRDVVKIMQQRGLILQPDKKDDYVNLLHRSQRRASEAYLLDRLLVAAIVEARGHERFSLIGEALEDPTLKRFYQSISSSEARHSLLFTDLANLYYSQTEIQKRLDELLAVEAKIIASLPLRAALH
jgi:tRNA-(ms[2]io[6]A)-hydroxylase